MLARVPRLPGGAATTNRFDVALNTRTWVEPIITPAPFNRVPTMRTWVPPRCGPRFGESAVGRGAPTNWNRDLPHDGLLPFAPVTFTVTGPGECGGVIATMRVPEPSTKTLGERTPPNVRVDPAWKFVPTMVMCCAPVALPPVGPTARTCGAVGGVTLNGPTAYAANTCVVMKCHDSFAKPLFPQPADHEFS